MSPQLAKTSTGKGVYDVESSLLEAVQTTPASVDVCTEGSQEIGDKPSTPARFGLPLPPEVLAVRFHRGAPTLMTAEHGTTLPVTEGEGSKCTQQSCFQLKRMRPSLQEMDAAR